MRLHPQQHAKLPLMTKCKCMSGDIRDAKPRGARNSLAFVRIQDQKIVNVVPTIS
ncbi:hypothetical protein Plhal304r1_c021g0073331 [Plasmopara halstedii]